MSADTPQSLSPPPPSPDPSPEAACLNCAQGPIAYRSPTCRHPTLCKKCAMRQATGGKCKVCGELFSELQRI